MLWIHASAGSLHVGPLRASLEEPPEDILESKIRNAIVFCATKTEQERLDRKDGIGPDGAGSTDPTYLYLKKIKANWLDLLGIFEKDKTLENLSNLKEAKRVWRKALKDSKRSREGAQTQWWTQILQVSKEFWKYLSSLDKPSLKRKIEMDRVKAENGEITKTIDEALAVQTRWCKRVACTDWADEIGIEPSEEEERFSSLFCVFQEWRGVAIESKWKREDENGERSTLNQVCNDDLLETELDIGLKKGRPRKASGTDDIPNEAFISMDRANKRHIKDVWTSFFRNSSAPAVWSQSEKKYIDKKEATCLLDEKRGVSLLSIHGKKYHHAVTARSDLILGATSSRTQGASKGVGCMPQILGLSQIIANRWGEGRKVICVAIDLKRHLTR